MLTNEQLALRKSFVCGSDAGIIVGVNKYSNRVDLYLNKLGLTPDEDISGNQYVMAGNMLEGAIAKWFEHATGWETIEEPEMIIHPDYPWMAGNIDRRIVGQPKAILEIKTSSQPKDWGEEMTAEIPEQYLMQVAHYCAVTNSDVCYIAVLFHGIDFRIYKYERNLRLEKNLIEAERNFWEENILKQVPPAPLTAKEVVSLRASINTGGTAIATGEITDAYEEYMQLKRDQDFIEDKMKVLKDKICVYIGQNDLLLDGFGNPLATWRSSTPTLFDRNKFEKDYPDLFKQYQKKGEPQRRFLPKQK